MKFYQTKENKIHQKPSIDQSLSLQEHLKILTLSTSELELYALEFLEANPVVEDFEDPRFLSSHPYDAIASNPKEVLFEQIPTQLLSTPDQVLAQEILESLDSEGFLQPEEKRRLNETYPSQFQRVLSLLQSLSGLGFETLVDYWIYQLNQSGKHPLCLKILQESKQSLLEGQLRTVMKKYALTGDLFKNEVLHALRKLSTSPLEKGLSRHPFEKIDVEITSEADQLDFQVFCPLPSFRISSMALEGPIEVKEFYKPYLRALKDFVEGFKKRKKTLERLLSIILPLQKDYLIGEVGMPRPLAPEALAHELGVHPSTIARCVQNKTLLFCKGLIPLKSLITPESQIKEKHRLLQDLLELVQTEDKTAPYSDDKLQKLLALRGSPIQRRTLTKYRHQLKIPDARRRFFS